MEEKNNSHWPILRSLLRSIQDKASKSIRGTNDRILISKHNVQNQNFTQALN